MRAVHRPAQEGVGRGRAVYFLFGLREDQAQDRLVREAELATLEDDRALLCAHGYTVVVEPAASRGSLRQALYGQDPELPGLAPAGVYWSSHGSRDGALQLPSGEWIPPGDVDPALVRPELAWVVFSSCHTGKHRRIWQARLGPGVLVVAWGRLLRGGESLAFNTADQAGWGLDDLLRETLLPGGRGAAALPPAPEDWEDPRFDPGVLLRVCDPAEDARWEALFEQFRPQVLAGIEDRTGLSSRQAAWRLGGLLLQGALSWLLPGREAEAEEQRAAAQWLAEQVGGWIPPWPERTGELAADVRAMGRHLDELRRGSALARAVERCGPDHEALLACSLGLAGRPFRSPQEQVARSQALLAEGPAAGLPAGAWARAVASSDGELPERLDELLEALAAERSLDHRARWEAWCLGKRLALAALVGARGSSPSKLEELQQGCAASARALGLEPPAAPRASGPAGVEAELSRLTPRLVAALRARHGRDAAALLGLALELPLLRLRWSPGLPGLGGRVEAARLAARGGLLPRAVWGPLQDLGRLPGREPAVAALDAVRDAVEAHLRVAARTT